MIIPLGERFHQDIYLLEKKHGQARPQTPDSDAVRSHDGPFGERADRRSPTRSIRRSHNGGFEERDADGEPAVWYYLRQMTLVEDDAPEGQLCRSFRERGSRAASPRRCRAWRIDGRSIGIVATSRSRSVATRSSTGRSRTTRPTCRCNFLRHQPPPDRRRDRRPLGRHVRLARRRRARVRVPETAREAIDSHRTKWRDGPALRRRHQDDGPAEVRQGQGRDRGPGVGE